MACNVCDNVNKTEICSGRTAVMGCIEGTARIILDTKEYDDITENDIIVTPMTEPDSISAVKKSKGVITDRGGVLCHAAIVCREIKKPCVVGTKDATKKIKDGEIIRLCANCGKIYR